MLITESEAHAKLIRLSEASSCDSDLSATLGWAALGLNLVDTNGCEEKCRVTVSINISENSVVSIELDLGRQGAVSFLLMADESLTPTEGLS